MTRSNTLLLMVFILRGSYLEIVQCSLKFILLEITSMFVLRLSISRGELKELDLIASITPSAVHETDHFCR